jgi:hypothetical protein
LHAFRPGRPSLICNLIEPLRLPAVDRWVQTAYVPAAAAVLKQLRVAGRTSEHQVALALRGVLPLRGKVFEQQGDGQAPPYRSPGGLLFT